MQSFFFLKIKLFSSKNNVKHLKLVHIRKKKSFKKEIRNQDKFAHISFKSISINLVSFIPEKEVSFYSFKLKKRCTNGIRYFKSNIHFSKLIKNISKISNKSPFLKDMCNTIVNDLFFALGYL